MGVGISAAVLTGEVREATLSAFSPLARVPLPYHVFGLVNICDPQKEIVIEERILLYYKYDNNPVDCVKVFSSIYDVKPIGFRMLQYNFVNRSVSNQYFNKKPCERHCILISSNTISIKMKISLEFYAVYLRNRLI